MVVRRRLQLAGKALVFVTTIAYDRRQIFANDEIALSCISQFGECLEYYRVSLAGYVLMPTHLHALLGFKQIEQLSKFMQSFKILSSKRIKEQLNAIGEAASDFRLWNPRFDDANIFSDKQYRIKLDYIHNNPIRAGLVTNPCDWKYSSAIDWLTEGHGILEIDKNFSWLE